jgi:outer membrane receptor for ferrienterochelin and colicins
VCLRWLWIPVLMAAAASVRASDPPAVPPANSSGEDALFGDMPEVVGAALHSQTLAEAPASVTVVTAADIRKFGYRTLGDVLSAVRGFTLTSDHIYQYAGVRGFAIPGDYNSLILVMINGHPMTEIVFDSNNYFAQDFGLDLDLVDRIEIIRGPSSALYGSNGVLANINIVTKTPVDSPKFAASTETDSLGLRKAQAMASVDLGKGANLLVEGSGILDGGHDLIIPEYNTPAQNNGIANHLDGQSGYHSYADLTWNSWDFSAYFNTRLSRAPVLGDGATFDSQGQFYRDTRDFVGATYTHDFKTSSQLRWQIYYDHYSYSDRYDQPRQNGIVDNRDQDWGDWITSQLTYRLTDPLGGLTLGATGTVEIRNLQTNQDFSPDHTVYLDISHPEPSLAFFAQQEWAFARNWTAYFGARLDESPNFGVFVSPQASVVYQPSVKTSYKFVYGRPFRAPSSFEQYYAETGYQVANPRLRPETAQSLEFTVERHFAKSFDAVVNAYRYWLESVIEAVDVPDGAFQYQNVGTFHSTGLEFELHDHPAGWLDTTVSFSLQHAADAAGETLPNAPARIAKFRAAVPLYRDRVHFSTGFQYLSVRLTADRVPVRPVALLDATISTSKLFRGADFVAGVRNALNWSYADPVDLIDQIPANGRSVFLKLSWRQGE